MGFVMAVNEKKADDWLTAGLVHDYADTIIDTSDLSDDAYSALHSRRRKLLESLKTVPNGGMINEVIGDELIEATVNRESKVQLSLRIRTIGFLLEVLMANKG